MITTTRTSLSLLRPRRASAQWDHHVEGHGVHALGPVEGDQRDVGPGMIDQYEVIG